MHSKESRLQNISLFIILLFHVSGAIGILASPYQDWFIQNTTLNLIISTILLFITQKEKNKWFYLFFLITYLTGFAVEWIGVNTGALFGSYIYGDVLGMKVWGVPLMIGVNWFIIMYSSGVIASQVYEWMNHRFAGLQTSVTLATQVFSFVIDGALLATFFDFVIEPVAVKLGFWRWLGDGSIPLYNYTCWFLVSTALLTVFRLLPFDKNNRLAVHLFIIQLLFFSLLRIFL